MDNKIHLSEPPIYNHHRSNALYYRSNVDGKEYIILIQSRCPNQRICKYDIKNDKYIAICANNFHLQPSKTYALFPFKFPKLSHIISAENNKKQLLTICTNKNQLAALNLTNLNYTQNYQSPSNKLHKNNNNHNIIWPIIFSIFLCNNCILLSFVYSIFLYFVSIKIANFTHQFEKDIKCVIPHFELLYNIESCYVDNDGIHFIANNHKNENTNKSSLNHLKFSLKSRQFIQLKTLKTLNTYKRELEEIRAYKIVYIEFTSTLIMFTNSENIYYYDYDDQQEATVEWRIFDDIKLPKIPGNGEWEINIVVGFKGIIFLFYYHGLSTKETYDSDSDDDDECIYTYCWDLLFTGDMFECDNKYLFNNLNGHCVAVNTENNYTHFLGENPLPFHFKISLNEEIPVELAIIHLQYFHLLIKQYIFALNTDNHKIPNDIEMLILDYFPMFL